LPYIRGCECLHGTTQGASFRAEHATGSASKCGHRCRYARRCTAASGVDEWYLPTRRARGDSCIAAIHLLHRPIAKRWTRTRYGARIRTKFADGVRRLKISLSGVICNKVTEPMRRRPHERLPRPTLAPGGLHRARNGRVASRVVRSPRSGIRLCGILAIGDELGLQHSVSTAQQRCNRWADPPC